MIVRIVCKANPTVSSEMVEGITLEITEPIPPLSMDGGWELSTKDFYDNQAKIIVEALAHLPQGTKHALLVRLLQEKVCLLQIK